MSEIQWGLGLKGDWKDENYIDHSKPYDEQDWKDYTPDPNYYLKSEETNFYGEKLEVYDLRQTFTDSYLIMSEHEKEKLRESQNTMKNL